MVRLVHLARDLLDEAQHDPHWPSLVEREIDLRQAVQNLLEAPFEPEEVAALRIALQELLALNRQLLAKVDARRRETARALEHTSLVRRAARAYHHTASA